MDFNSKQTHDFLTTKVLVVGAGPAGISFGYQFSKYSNDFIVVDMGSSLNERNRHDDFDCIGGTGGAGLFSDGKFSFFPSGTALWKLPNKERMESSYGELMNVFQESIDVKIPNFPTDAEMLQLDSNNNYELKKYPCFYISLEKRTKLINFMTENIKNLLLNHKVEDWEKIDGQYLVHTTHTKTNKKTDILCDHLILAGGRFHPLFIKDVKKVFKRYEYGVRLVGPNKEFEAIRQEMLDPKWMYRPTKELEFRTFCMCKDGEYICSNFLGIQSYSGRADVPETGITNFGLTARIKVENNEDFSKIINCSPFEESLVSITNNVEFLQKIFGKKLGLTYMTGLQKFIENFRLNPEELKVIGPSIEGVGEYPDINEELQVDGENIFVIGDCCGIFRGIIPSMISGIYIANLLKTKLHEKGLKA